MFAVPITACELPCTRTCRLQANRHADALIVASLVGGELWDRARQEYMFANPHPYMRVVHAMLGSDWQGGSLACGGQQPRGGSQCASLNGLACGGPAMPCLLG